VDVTTLPVRINANNATTTFKISTYPKAIAASNEA